jgi:hypothetical protein
MAIHVDTYEDWIRYVPDYEDNRLSDEPMDCEILPMSAAEVRDLRSRYAAKLQGKGAERRAVAMVERILRDHVRDVRRCYIGRQIRTGDDLAKHGLSELIDDVFQAVVSASHLDAGVKKKSSSQSGCSAAVTTQSTGVTSCAV